MPRSRLRLVRLALLVALAPVARAQEEIPAPGTEEYVEARVEAVVDYLRNDENDANLQYSATPFLVRYLERHGVGALPAETRAEAAAFVRGALEGLRTARTEAARLRAGIAVRLSPWFADEEVRSLLHEALELHLEKIAWRPEFFATIREVGLTEALPHFLAVVDEFAALAPDEVATARYPYPIREAFACLAALGGDAEAERLAPYLRAGVPAQIRGPALTALGEMGGERARALLDAFARDTDDLAAAAPAERWAWGDALRRLDDSRGARALLALVEETGDPRAWESLRRAAGRPLETVEEARAWVEAVGDGSLRAARRAAIEAGGYAIGDLSTPEQQDALLAAALDDDPFRRRAAWDEVVRLLGHDPSHGRFWTYRAERRGVEVDVVHRPGQELAEEDATRLREVQEEMVERATRLLRAGR